jgi:hypothetical protein
MLRWCTDGIRVRGNQNAVNLFLLKQTDVQHEIPDEVSTVFHTEFTGSKINKTKGDAREMALEQNTSSLIAASGVRILPIPPSKLRHVSEERPANINLPRETLKCKLLYLA